MTPEVVYKPGHVPIRGLRTSLEGPELGQGYFQTIDGLRWPTGIFTVRNGPALICSTAPTRPVGNSICLGAADAYMNGSLYHVSAYVNQGQTTIHSLNLTTGALSELTLAMGNSGGTGVPGWGAPGVNDTVVTANATDSGGTRMGKKWTVTGATNATPIVVTVANHEFHNGDWVEVGSVGGNAAANGAFYVGRATTNTFALYSDQAITIPVAGTGNYTSGGKATRIHQVRFQVVTIGPRQIGGTVYPSTDVLVIQNLENYALVYTPELSSFDTGFTSESLKVFQHQPIVLPALLTSFDVFHRFSSYFQVAHTSGAYTYANSHGADYKLGDTSTAPYNSGSNYCILATLISGTVNGDTAKVDFGAATSFNGEQINFFAEGSTSALYEWFINCKVEVSADDLTYYTIFDSKNSDPTVAELPIFTAADLTSNRQLVTYSLKNVPAANRSFRYLKFTRNGAYSGSTLTLTILMIAGAAGGGGFLGNTEWWCSFKNLYSYAESGGIDGVNQGGDIVNNYGGPSGFTSGSSSVSQVKIPVNEAVLYDFKFHVANPAIAGQETIYGGLAGLPSVIDLYFRTAEEAALGVTASFWSGLKVYERGTSGSDHIWALQWTGGGGASPIMNITSEMGSWWATYGVTDRYQRDETNEVPAGNNIAMPRSAAIWFANQRAFVGNVKDPLGHYQRGDLYISRIAQPFRFQPESTDGDPNSGTRTNFSGEAVMAGIMTAAGAMGSSNIYVYTNLSFNALGTAGGFVGSGYDVSALGRAIRISSNGTLEPNSIHEWNGVLFWDDQIGQINRYVGGMPQPISKNAVDSATKGIPASMRGFANAEYWNDRYLFCYAGDAATDNTRMLAWSETLQEWEFDDSAPSTLTFQQIVRTTDPSMSGGGQRLLVYSGDGSIYGWEESASELNSTAGVAIEIATREFQSKDWNVFKVGRTQAMVDGGTGMLYVDAYYKPFGSQFRSQLDFDKAPPASPNGIQAVKITPPRKREVTSLGVDEKGWSAYLDLNGSLSCGTMIWRIETELEEPDQPAGTA